MKKALIVATVAGFVATFEINDIRLLQSLGYEVYCATNVDALVNEEKKQMLRDMGIELIQIDFSRTPFSKQVIRAYQQLKAVFTENHFDIVHCHTPMGGVVGRVAARKYRKYGTKVIYTAHGFHFYKGAPLKNWLLYFPVEWICAHWTDILITINKEDYARANRYMRSKNVIYIPGVGIDTKKFSPTVPCENNREKLRISLGIRPDEKMLLSVGELSRRKNHAAVIQALSLLNNKKIKYFICGQGELEKELKTLIDKLKLTDSVYLLGYRTDISELCHSSDLFVFPSMQEGLPVALMEAIASRTPIICSNVRGNTDLVSGEMFFDPSDSYEIATKIEEYINSDKSLEIEHNYMQLRKYDIENVVEDMQSIYLGGVKYLNEIYMTQLLRKSIGVPIGIKLIFSVGELNRNKNHEVVIRALAHLENRNVHYAIAGTGELKEYLINLAEQLGIGDQVHLLGYRRDVADLYKAADLYIHPSLREGLPVALMEAMACGLPVVCSRIRGNVDLIKNGDGGLLCASNEIDEYKDAINNILTNRSLAEKMGQVNVNRVRNCDISKVREMNRLIYESDLNKIEEDGL